MAQQTAVENQYCRIFSYHDPRGHLLNGFLMLQVQEQATTTAPQHKHCWWHQLAIRQVC